MLVILNLKYAVYIPGYQAAVKKWNLQQDYTYNSGFGPNQDLVHSVSISAPSAAPTPPTQRTAPRTQGPRTSVPATRGDEEWAARRGTLYALYSGLPMLRF